MGLEYYIHDRFGNVANLALIMERESGQNLLNIKKAFASAKLFAKLEIFVTNLTF